MRSLGDGESWIDASQAMRTNLNAETIEVTLRAGFKANRPLNERAVSAIQNMFSGHALRESIDKFNISAVMDGSTEAIPIDLLEDKLVANVEIPRHTFQNADRRREFMYERIKKEYTTLKPDIDHAARISRG